jgi:hypothetical protein
MSYYVIENHLGGCYIGDYDEYPKLEYCDQCGDIDFVISGPYETYEEANEYLEDMNNDN